MDSKVWICGRLIGEWEESGSKWAFQGVFSTEKLAIDACRDEAYFIFSSNMDTQLPHEDSLPPDGYYPVIENALTKEKK